MREKWKLLHWQRNASAHISFIYKYLHIKKPRDTRKCLQRASTSTAMQSAPWIIPEGIFPLALLHDEQNFVYCQLLSVKNVKNERPPTGCWKLLQIQPAPFAELKARRGLLTGFSCEVSLTGRRVATRLESTWTLTDGKQLHLEQTRNNDNKGRNNLTHNMTTKK